MRLTISGLSKRIARRLAIRAPAAAGRPAAGNPIWNSRRFAIVSNGRTASYWLAAALDAHPQISCGHAKNDPPIPDYTASDKTRTAGVEGPQEAGALYDLLERSGPGPYYGTVHSFVVGTQNELAALGIPFTLLTRHPVARCDSFADRRRIEMKQSDVALERTRDSVLGNLERFPRGKEPLRGIDESDWIPFVAACFDVANEAVSIDQFPHVLQSERVTSDPDCLARFLYEFLGLTVSPEYLDEVYSRGSLNTLSGLRRSASSIFFHWPDWKKETFRIFAESYGFSRFSEHGYNVDGIIAANRVNDAWIDGDGEAVAALGNAPYVIRNLGRLNPPYLRAGTVVDIFVRVSRCHLAIDLGGRTNSTQMLHHRLPEGTRIARISFETPKEPGMYPLLVADVEARDGQSPGPAQTLVDVAVEVRSASMNLPDQGLLRTIIAPVSV
jgi:hypothetical protein